ncbi:MAG: hypothetical protein ACRD1R_02330 [Acidobacteriota bacterium]
MRQTHIHHLLGGKGLAELTPAELTEARGHIGGCPSCRRAFDAAQTSQALLLARAAEQFEPDPFFKTRVMASVGTSREAPVSFPGFEELWQRAPGLLTFLLLVVATLGGLNALVNGAGPPSWAAEDASGLFSAEQVLAQDPELEQITDNQIIMTLYGGAETNGEP